MVKQFIVESPENSSEMQLFLSIPDPQFHLNIFVFIKSCIYKNYLMLIFSDTQVWNYFHNRENKTIEEPMIREIKCHNYEADQYFA